MRHRHAGFTLTEVMIVVVIVAVLAAIALPAYTNYTREANRADAQHALLMLANQQEKNYVANNSYTADFRQLVANCATEDVKAGVKRCAADGSTYNTDKTLYTVQVTAADANAFTLQATANSGTSQFQDEDCRTITLDSAGRKLGTTAGGASSDVCWGR